MKNRVENLSKYSKTPILRQMQIRIFSTFYRAGNLSELIKPNIYGGRKKQTNNKPSAQGREDNDPHGNSLPLNK